MAQDNIGNLPVLVTPFSMQNIQKSLVFAIRNKGNLVTGIKWKIVVQWALFLSPKLLIVHEYPYLNHPCSKQVEFREANTLSYKLLQLLFAFDKQMGS